jgi:hypothetical protein
MDLVTAVGTIQPMFFINIIINRAFKLKTESWYVTTWDFVWVCNLFADIEEQTQAECFRE